MINLLHLAFVNKHSLDMEARQLLEQKKARVTPWLGIERVIDLEFQDLGAFRHKGNYWGGRASVCSPVLVM